MLATRNEDKIVPTDEDNIDVRGSRDLCELARIKQELKKLDEF